MFNRTEAVNNLLALMQLQNTYICELNKLIYAVIPEMTLDNNYEFAKFAADFFEFACYHYTSEGYAQAVQLVETYHYILWERLLDSQIVVAAEKIELAIQHLELAALAEKNRFYPQILLLNQAISVLEETQLKIIEIMEEVLLNLRPALLLEN